MTATLLHIFGAKFGDGRAFFHDGLRGNVFAQLNLRQQFHCLLPRLFDGQRGERAHGHFPRTALEVVLNDERFPARWAHPNAEAGQIPAPRHIVAGAAL